MNNDQCQTCGRMSEDWSRNRSAGNKGEQRINGPDRMTEYRRWRFTLGGGCYVSDIDQVEWRMVDGQVFPVKILEMTQLDGAWPPPPLYLSNILKRFNERDGQGKAVKEMARRLRVDAVIVLYRKDLSEVWLFNLTQGIGWINKPWPAYERWIRAMEVTR